MIYNLQVAEHVLEKGDYSYVLFFGHLYLEKLLQALIVKDTGEHAPFKHDLELLAVHTTLMVPEDRLIALRRMTSFNISARYPEDSDKLKKKFTQEFASDEFNIIKELGQWLKHHLKS